MRPAGPMRRMDATTACAVLLLVAPHVVAQSFADFHAGRWEGAMGFGYLRDHEQVQSQDGAPSTSFDRSRWSEEVSVANRGFFFLDPRFASGSLGLALGLVQDRETDDGARASVRTKLVGYELETSFLEALPYNARLFAHRTQQALTQPFGRTDSTFENRGAALHLREDSPLRDRGFPYLSADLLFEQQRTAETTTSVLGQSFRRNAVHNSLGLDAHKGFETADLDGRYEFTDLSDATAAQTSFQSHTGTLDYSLDFGPTLNRRSDTRLFAYTRSGVSPTTLLTANEDVSIAHWSNLSTNYRYSFARTHTLAGATTGHDAAFGVSYAPYRNLDVDGQAFGSHEQLTVGMREGYGALGDFRYRHGVLWNGNLELHGSARYRVDRNRLTASLVNVVDEAQTAPAHLGAGAGFLLAQPFVLGASVQVVDLRGGARVPALLGIDYELVVEGNRLRVVPLVTSPLIQPNDPLAVTYSYQIDPSISFSTTTRSVGASLGFKWVDFAWEHNQSDEKLLAGEDNGLLQDVRQDSAKVDLHGTWRRFEGHAGTTFDRYRSQRLDYSGERYDAAATWRATRNLMFGLNASHAATDFTLPAHRTRALSAQLSYDWHLPWGFAANGLLARRSYADTLQATETITEARLGARVNYGKLSVSASLLGAERQRGGSRTSNRGIDITVNRRF